MAPRKIEDIIRPDVWDIEEYVPIEPPEVLSQARGVALERIIKLDGNENPYGCSPRVNQALAQHQGYQFYPDPGHQELRQLLQGYIGLDARYIMAGSGSDEIIDLLLRAIISPGDKIINCTPTFGMYRFSTQVCGGQAIEVPRDDQYQVVPERVLAAIDERTKAIFLASPNNPTGTSTPWEMIAEFLKTSLLVVVDEVYCEFSGRTLVQEVP
ncbi:MAG: aminotransferase class I/II-fold pyridoxal phosphate-dependent enzyme, partial [Dehalococcoidia bacterium]|nr:aminotransferase class I/II-fold pyridoxal phosphate-dependent enzyme [Dehalococcoidia bacterium]